MSAPSLRPRTTRNEGFSGITLPLGEVFYSPYHKLWHSTPMTANNNAPKPPLPKATDSAPPAVPPMLAIPEAVLVAIRGATACAMTPEGEILDWPINRTAPLVLNDKIPIMTVLAPRTAKLLGLKTYPAFDVLELYAFVFPAQFCAPTVSGLCRALRLPVPADLEDEAISLAAITRELLHALSTLPERDRKTCLAIAGAMGRQGQGWPWTPFVFSALGEKYNPDIPTINKQDMNIWKDLPEWSEEAPKPPSQHHSISADEAASALKDLVQGKVQNGQTATQRPAQETYSRALSGIFAPRLDMDDCNVLTAEAGTGVGKTLGYLAPAKLWAERNDQSIWISTYTRNLQRQMDQEMRILYPDDEERSRKAVIRKGRENYLCLLNLEEMVAASALARSDRVVVAAGLMARWAAATRDGDMTGNDFPGWLGLILGYQNTYGLNDQRGECIYSACDHYHKCFVERTVRRSKRAKIVVANHALVMIQTAIAGAEEDLPLRYVFDEGHHLFDAADSAYGAHLTGFEAAELRRWILGPETSGKRTGRAKGLQKRLEDLISGQEDAEGYMHDILSAARQLPAPSWQKRLIDGLPSGPTEVFLSKIRQQILARSGASHGFYSLETDIFPLSPDITQAAVDLKKTMLQLQKPMKLLAKSFIKIIDENAAYLEKETRKRIDAAIRSLVRKSDLHIGAWIGMLDLLISPAQAQAQPTLYGGTEAAPSAFADWFELSRMDGRDHDVGMFRHYIDPMRPFAESMKPHAHGIAITSATLRDVSKGAQSANTSGANDANSKDWSYADKRTGAAYFAGEAQPMRLSIPSPYDYAAQTRILVINDIPKNNGPQVATAFRELFKASGGGGLGIFTAVQRMKFVYDHIHAALGENDIPLYAQHVDDIDIGTLVDIFREDEHSCLLGTDAVRDGVDVPGHSLRLLVFDRVPWPRPTILHRQRRDHFGGRSYDEALTRLKLKQAYGRLIRSETDKGVFVMLDNALPSRLYDAFPEGAEIVKCSLHDAIKTINTFL